MEAAVTLKGGSIDPTFASNDMVKAKGTAGRRRPYVKRVESTGMSAGTGAVSDQSLRVGQIIRSLRLERGWNQRELAEHAGVTQQNINSYETGKRQHPRYLPQVANALGVSVEHIIGISDSDLGIDNGMMLCGPGHDSLARGGTWRTIPFVGSAAAGRWIDPRFQDEEPRIPRVDHIKYGDSEQYALRVAGQSLNRKFPDQSIAICTPYEDARPSGPRNGDLVHAILRRGQLEQWAIKYIKLKPGIIELHPDSTDPRFEPYVFDEKKMRSVTDEDETTLEIRGLVFYVQMALAMA